MRYIATFAALAALAVAATGCGSQASSSAPAAPAKAAPSDQDAQALYDAYSDDAPATSYEFTSKELFERSVKSSWVRLQNEQNDAGVTEADVSQVDCVKTSETGATCVLVASDAYGPMRSKVDVSCSDSAGNDCMIESTPIN